MSLILIAADLVAIVLLVFGLFVPRHHRRDLVVAFLVVNVGVLAVMATLSATSVGVGWGSASSACSRSSGCAPRSSPSTRSPTTSPR